jgi:hypothetical protein
VTACTILRAPGGPGVRLTHGVAIGETSDTRAVLWARCEAPAMLDVRVDGRALTRVPVLPERDLTARVPIGGLEPGVEHAYEVRCGPGPAVSGRFRTARRPSDAAAVRFVFGGDVGGQNVCRDAARGYPIFATIVDQAPDFFVALGDMIYADGACRADGALGNAQIPGPPPALDLESFRAHWRYNRADAGTQRLLASTTYYAVWDDHEVRNDFGPGDDAASEAPERHLFEAGEAAFRDWAPVDDAAPLHRQFRWGRHAEVFLLDTRGRRDVNAAPDTGREPKSLLGAAQRGMAAGGPRRLDGDVEVRRVERPDVDSHRRRRTRRLGGRRRIDRVRARARGDPAPSGARPGPWPRVDHDGRALRDRLPLPAVRRCADFIVHEFVSGPLAAGLFPKDDLDPTLRPVRLFFHGPAAGQAPRTLDEALSWFNFGRVEVDADGRLFVSIVDGTGRTRHRVTVASP